MTIRGFRKDQMRNIAAKTRKPKKEKGFTLLEVLIAISIFAIGILAVGTMQISAINGNASARGHTEAATWAADRIERLISVPYASLANGGPVVQGNYTIGWTVDPPVNNTRTVRVVVRWTDRGRQKRVFFDFVRAQDV